MALTIDDRIAFSLAIMQAAATILGIQGAQNAINAKAASLQKLDTANNNLFDPVNTLINGYQAELQLLDGNGRTQILESDIINAGSHTLRNVFFPNDTTVTIPDLVPFGNVWSKLNPFALGYGIGKSYVETYTPVTKEGDDIGAINAIITASSVYTDFELTTGTAPNGTCSIVTYVDQVTCEANSGIWTPGVGSSPDPNIATIKTNLVTAVNALKTFLTAEVAAIVTTDTTSPNQANNAAAVNNINTVLVPALNTWLTYPDFEVTGAGPSKLHSTQLTALQLSLSTRLTFITTRIAQLNAVLGTIAQDLTTGDVTGSGLYLRRYSFLTLRLNALNGTLTQLLSLQGGSNAQTQIIANILSTKNTYLTLLYVGAFTAAANGTAVIHIVDASGFSPGDFVYVFADDQDELTRAIKSINGNAVTLNDVVPQKYTTSNNARIYKVL
jgi:hypothetical protein